MAEGRKKHKEDEPPKVISIGITLSGYVFISLERQCSEIDLTPEQARDIGLGLIEASVKAHALQDDYLPGPKRVQ
jgi:hypothetical protein